MSVFAVETYVVRAEKADGFDPALQEFLATAISLGLLPANPDGDLLTLWQVTRPAEYIRACRAAYELR